MRAVIYTIICLITLNARSAGWNWQEQAYGRKAQIQSPGTGKLGFTLMKTAVAFTNILNDERGLTNQIYMSGSGVAAGDVDACLAPDRRVDLPDERRRHGDPRHAAEIRRGGEARDVGRATAPERDYSAAAVLVS